jgi:hypothetical protein
MGTGAAASATPGATSGGSPLKRSDGPATLPIELIALGNVLGTTLRKRGLSSEKWSLLTNSPGGSSGRYDARTTPESNTPGQVRKRRGTFRALP